MGDPADRQSSVPWSLVYDLQIPQDPGLEFRLCPSIRTFGPGGRPGALPPHCPEQNHDGNVLCPFGFWGRSCVLEQPASCSRMIQHVLTGDTPISVAMVIDPGLDSTLTKRHAESLKKLLPGSALQVFTVSDPSELARVLAPETMDIAYLYCHGGYHKMARNALPSSVLRFGTAFLHPVDVGSWRRSADFWPRPHWPDRKPLVVLNGCNTTELTTATLSNFVDAFVNRAGAAGVIGTEVAVEQGMAGWALELLIQHIVTGHTSVGDALRRVRWLMINRGNTMGLAYTMYCMAGLQLRSATAFPTPVDNPEG